MLPLLAACVISLAFGAAVAAVLLRRTTAVPARDTVNELAGEDAELHAEPARLAALPLIGLAMVVASVGLGALMVLIERETWVTHWDENIERWATSQASDFGASMLTAITHLGDSLTITVVSCVVAVFVIITRRNWQVVLFLGAVVVGQFLLTNLIKWAFDRARPELDPLTTFSGSSFPSGHTTAAAATYLAIALILGTYVGTRRRASLIGLGVAVGVAVACSRALLGVHWFTDVLGGLLLGWTWCVVCWHAFASNREFRAFFGPPIRSIGLKDASAH